MTLRALVLIAAVGCTDDVSYGEVQLIDRGDETVALRACLDAELFSCAGQEVVLTATHDGARDEMTYGGFLFAEHHGALPLGSRSAPFLVIDGTAVVEMRLPPAFELSASTDAPLGPRDSVTLHWAAARMPMVWSVDYSCPREGTTPRLGGALGDTISDDGSLVLTGARIAEVIGESSVGCSVELELSRVREGDVDDAFRAERATAIVRRSVTLSLL